MSKDTSALLSKLMNSVGDVASAHYWIEQIDKNLDRWQDKDKDDAIFACRNALYHLAAVLGSKFGK